jgi:hypothetical protein
MVVPGQSDSPETVVLTCLVHDLVEFCTSSGFV